MQAEETALKISGFKNFWLVAIVFIYTHAIFSVCTVVLTCWWIIIPGLTVVAFDCRHDQRLGEVLIELSRGLFSTEHTVWNTLRSEHKSGSTGQRRAAEAGLTEAEALGLSSVIIQLMDGLFVCSPVELH